MQNLKTLWKKIIIQLAGSDKNFQAHRIKEGGSDRRFYRLEAGGSSFILLEFSTPEELKEYVSVGDFLFSRKFSAPRRLFLDRKEMVAVYEDGGKKNLQSHILNLLFENKTGPVIDIYKNVIDELIVLQSIPFEEIPFNIKARPFNFDHYRWESDYFREKCAGLFFGLGVIEDGILTRELDFLAGELVSESRFIVHRDFQSQNILFDKTGKITVIDFQSARLGSRFYDLASLLKDPYVELPDSVHDELLGYYLSHPGWNEDLKINMKKATETYNKVALQRLMQALGAYGKLGIDSGKPEFLKYVKPALSLTKKTVKEVKGLGKLKELIETLINKESDYFS
ncbi:MAG: phosphotransferase [Vulcanimicrobiota bacterium]